MGLERLILLLQEQGVKAMAKQTVWIAYMGEELRAVAFALASELRRNGVACSFAYAAKNLKISSIKQTKRIVLML